MTIGRLGILSDGSKTLESHGSHLEVAQFSSQLLTWESGVWGETPKRAGATALADACPRGALLIVVQQNSSAG
jgi:hypothetical protein